MNILVIIQARTGSSRLPNKVMMPLAGRPLLQRMIERVERATTPSGLLVATTLEPADNPIRNLCAEIGVNCFSGHATDLLDRHYKAGLEYRADVIVKIPSDCPLIDPRVVDRVITFWQQNRRTYDYVSNLHPATWPDGQDVEVIPMNLLERAWRNAAQNFEREHTTPWIWERPELFRLGNVVSDDSVDRSMTHRWTIDYPEDYTFLTQIFDALWSANRPDFSVEEILAYLEQSPTVSDINKMYAGVNWYRHHLHELRTVDRKRTRNVKSENVFQQTEMLQYD
ncbi:MAG: NTP transferase domain-containing protein [Candidatus Kapaibacterium sp.]